MQVIVQMLIALFVMFSFSACAPKECVPIVKYVKPEKVNIPEASVEQCRSDGVLDNAKCVLKNYFNVKKERDQLRSAIDEITE